LTFISSAVGHDISFLAWCLKNENVHCVLLGASSVEQLYENINSLQIVAKLTPAIMADIDRILGNKPVPRVSTKSEVHFQSPLPSSPGQR
jgi:predicted aldo/keto reductase-like oxidoreductase